MTAPFPFHPATGPQAPMLRPDPLHEEPGALGSLTPIMLHIAGQMQKQQSDQQDMLVKKGQLALEQEKADAEIQQHQETMKMAKQKQATLDQTATQLTQALQTANSPQAMIDGLQKSIGGLVSGGDPQQAVELVKSIAGMRQMMMAKQQDDAENQKIASYLSANPAAVNDPAGRRAIKQLIYGINPKKADEFEKAFPEQAAKEATVVNTPEGGKSTVLGPDLKPVLTIQGNPKQNKQTALDVRVQQRLPTLQAALQGMEAIENNDIKTGGANVKQVADAMAAGNLPVFGKLIEGVKNFGLSQDAAAYAMYVNQAKDAIMGMTPNVRGSKDQLALWDKTFVPYSTEMNNKNTLAKRQQMRRMQAQNMAGKFSEQWGAATPVQPDSSSALGAPPPPPVDWSAIQQRVGGG